MDQPIIVESKYLQLPGTNQKHPLYPKPRLIAVTCTRCLHKQAQFIEKQSMTLRQCGEMKRKTNTNGYSNDEKKCVMKGASIQCRTIKI